MTNIVSLKIHTANFSEINLSFIAGNITLWISYEEIIGYELRTLDGKRESLKVPRGTFSRTTSKHTSQIYALEANSLEHFKDNLRRASARFGFNYEYL